MAATAAAAETTAIEGAEAVGIAEVAAVGIGAMIATEATTADGDFTPRTAASGSTDLPSNLAPPPIHGEHRPVRPPLHKNPAANGDTAQVSQSRAAPPPRKKLTSYGEYVLERACIFCNRDDDYFKNVIRKYIFLRGANLVAGAMGDTRDSNAESKDRYLIHLLKNL